MSDDFVARHRGLDPVANLLASIDVKSRLEGRNAVHGALYLWAKTALPHYILSNLGDRMEMAHSVEGRVAFMDHHVAEYLHRVPVSLKIRGMTEKYILREAMKGIITDTVYRRQKHPFLSPPATLKPRPEAPRAHAGHTSEPRRGLRALPRPCEGRRSASIAQPSRTRTSGLA